MPLPLASLIEPLWVEFAALIGTAGRPEVDPTHPLGCSGAGGTEWRGLRHRLPRPWQRLRAGRGAGLLGPLGPAPAGAVGLAWRHPEAAARRLGKLRQDARAEHARAEPGGPVGRRVNHQISLRR